MDNYHSKVRLIIGSIFMLLALVIIFDFVLPGSIIQDEVIDVKRERQQYNNAARNYHFSYEVVTSNHQFSVTQEFAELIQENATIEYSISRIFGQVNYYRLATSKHKSFYSLRILSGLVLPLLSTILMLVAYRYQWKSSVLIFVFQTLLLADFIYLIVY